MTEQRGAPLTERTEKESLTEALAHQPTLTNFVQQVGLQEVAKAVEGENYVVCDLGIHGVQGCADMREAAQQQQMAAECVAIGLAILMAVIVGSLAVTFVDLITKLAAPVGKNRVYALFPRRRIPEQAKKEHTA
ncbi:MAG: hypothetical protein AAF683_00070 [Pseudomonadota bacterium]